MSCAKARFRLDGSARCVKGAVRGYKGLDAASVSSSYSNASTIQAPVSKKILQYAGVTDCFTQTKGTTMVGAVLLYCSSLCDTLHVPCEDNLFMLHPCRKPYFRLATMSNPFCRRALELSTQISLVESP